VLRLAAEVLQEPSFPSADFDEFRRAELADLESSRSDPESVPARQIRRYVSPYSIDDFRYIPTLDEEVAETAAVTLQDVIHFHRQFYGVAAAEVAVVGSFDSQEISRTIVELFGDWKSRSSYRRAVSLYRPVPAKKEILLTPDKANAIYLAESRFAIRDDDAQYPALLVGNEILGGGFLNSRLAKRIRQKDGLSYSVGSTISADSWDRVGSFNAYAICAPPSVSKLERDVLDEIRRAVSEGFTGQEIDAAKAGILQSNIVARSSDVGIASELARQLYLGRDFHSQEQLEDNIKRVSADEIQGVIRAYIDPAKFVIVEAGDFSKVDQLTAEPGNPPTTSPSE